MFFDWGKNVFPPFFAVIHVSPPGVGITGCSNFDGRIFYGFNNFDETEKFRLPPFTEKIEIMSKSMKIDFNLDLNGFHLSMSAL